MDAVLGFVRAGSASPSCRSMVADAGGPRAAGHPAGPAGPAPHDRAGPPQRRGAAAGRAGAAADAAGALSSRNTAGSNTSSHHAGRSVGAARAWSAPGAVAALVVQGVRHVGKPLRPGLARPEAHHRRPVVRAGGLLRAHRTAEDLGRTGPWPRGTGRPVRPGGHRPARSRRCRAAAGRPSAAMSRVAQVRSTRSCASARRSVPGVADRLGLTEQVLHQERRAQRPVVRARWPRSPRPRRATPRSARRSSPLRGPGSRRRRPARHPGCPITSRSGSVKSRKWPSTLAACGVGGTSQNRRSAPAHASFRTAGSACDPRTTSTRSRARCGETGGVAGDHPDPRGAVGGVEETVEDLAADLPGRGGDDDHEQLPWGAPSWRCRWCLRRLRRLFAGCRRACCVARPN